MALPPEIRSSPVQAEAPNNVIHSAAVQLNRSICAQPAARHYAVLQEHNSSRAIAAATRTAGPMMMQDFRLMARLRIHVVMINFDNASLLQFCRPACVDQRKKLP